MNVSVSLPEGVRLVEQGLVDELRGTVVPLNSLGAFVLRAAQTHDVAVVSTALADHFGIDRSDALGRVQRLLLDLNGLMLVNLRRRRPPFGEMVRRLLLDVSVLLAGGGAHPPVRLRTRRPVRTCRIGTTVLDVTRGLAAFLVGAGVVCAALSVVGTIAGVSEFTLSAATVIALASAGVVVHEVGHALALRGERAVLATSWMYSAVHHRRLSPRRALVVAAAGPTSTAVLGLVIVAVGAALSSAAIGIAGLTWVTHLVGLTNLSNDGRTLTQTT